MRRDEERWYSSDLDPKKTKDDGERRAAAVFAAVRALDGQEDYRRVQVARYIGLYENRDIRSLSPGEYPVPGQGLEGGEDGNLTLNVCQSCMDTIAGKLATKHPRPMFITDGGNYEDKLKAEGLQRFVMGNIRDIDLYEHLERVFYHAGIAGTGYIRPFYDKDRKKISVDVVFPTDIIVDEQAALDALPRSLFHRKYIPCDVLAARYPKFKTQISDAEVNVSKYLQNTDLVEVIEAFHLRSGPDAKDGLWSICVQGATLEESEWTRDEHEFIKFDWTKRIRGWNGKGLMEQLHGIQAEITKIIQGIQTNFALFSKPFLLKHLSSKINNSLFNNDDGNIIDWEGNIPPDLKVFMTTHPEIFNHLWALVQKAYEITGISELSATGVKPAGVEAGVALRHLDDVETRRFGMLVLALERIVLKVTRRIVELAAEHPELTVNWAEGTKFKKITFSDINLGELKYVLGLWPTNMLPDTPSGKFASVNDAVNSGVFTPEEAANMLYDYPDMKKALGRKMAPREHYELLIEHMMTTGAYVPPEIWQPLPLGISIMRDAWMEGIVNGIDEERLSGLIQWMNEAHEMLKEQEIDQQAKVQAAAMAKAGPQPGEPPMPQPPGPPS